MTSKNAISGFNSSGLFPVDTWKFPESLFNSKELQEYKKIRALVPIENPNSSVPQANFVAEMSENNGGIVVAGPSRENHIPETFRENINAIGTSRDNNTTPKKPDDKSQKTGPVTPSGIIQIFSSAMTKTHQQFQTSMDKPFPRKERKIPRLKPERYGEVLTSEQVLEKLKEVEEKKKAVEKEKEAKKLEKIKKKVENIKKPNLKRKLFSAIKHTKTKKN